MMALGFEVTGDASEPAMGLAGRIVCPGGRQIR
jgi:hypothetical protein